MNEPSSFVNGAVEGCKSSTLNKPPYMPRKDTWHPLLADPWVSGVIDARVQQSGAYPDHLHAFSLVFWLVGGMSKTNELQVFCPLGCIKIAGPVE